MRQAACYSEYFDVLNVNYPEAYGLKFLSAMYGLNVKREETCQWCTPRLGMGGHLSGTQKRLRSTSGEEEEQGKDITCLRPALRIMWPSQVLKYLRSIKSCAVMAGKEPSFSCG